MIFHTFTLTRQQAIFTLSGGHVEVVDSDLYQGITFIKMSGCFSTIQATKIDYATLVKPEWQFHQTHFKDPHTEVWQFNTMVTPSLMYMWTQIECPLVMILSQMIHDKASTTHTIITSPHDGRNIIPGNGLHQSDLSHPSQELQKTFEELKQMVTTEHTEESCTHS